MALPAPYISYGIALLGPATIAFYLFHKKLKKLKIEVEWNTRRRTKDLEKQKKQLELQKHEIRLQAEELKAITEQLQDTNELLVEQKIEIQGIYRNAEVLSEFGRKVTATLSHQQISSMVYNYVVSLMDATGFGLGIYNQRMGTVDFHGFVEQGTEQGFIRYQLTSPCSLTVHSFLKKQDIHINDFEQEWQRYISKPICIDKREHPKSFIILPLLFEGRPMGVVKVHSYQAAAYSQNDVTNLRSLATYIAIALENANVYEVVREQNKNIKSSISAAETIQKATLPMRDGIRDVFESFILYRPKDIVSGDFYWYASVDNLVSDNTSTQGEGFGHKTFFVAAVDCTGHGIPGAFVSMIGNSSLNEIVKEKRIYDTALILEALDQKIKLGLRQEETGNTDGMDVCLCRIDRFMDGRCKLSFTGAKRPLIYADTDGVVRLAKGDKKLIGKHSGRTQQKFTVQTFWLDRGASIFLTSDGYSDQNNTARKRFGTLSLVSLLQKNIDRPMCQIERTLEEALDAHMLNEPQRDDITVVGLRL